MTNDRYCTKCGSKLIRKDKKRGGFDYITGQPLMRYTAICPNYDVIVKLGFIRTGNGHTIFEWNSHEPFDA